MKGGEPGTPACGLQQDETPLTLGEVISKLSLEDAEFLHAEMQKLGRPIEVALQAAIAAWKAELVEKLATRQWSALQVIGGVQAPAELLMDREVIGRAEAVAGAGRSDVPVPDAAGAAPSLVPLPEPLIPGAHTPDLYPGDHVIYTRHRVGSVPVAGTSVVIDRFGLPSRTMESSLRAVRNLIGQSLSTKTWSSYEVAWQLWEEWKFAMGNSLESNILLLLLVGHCWEEGWSVPKINNCMAGLAFGFKIRGLPDVTKAILVRQALKGWRRGWKVRDCRRPISYGLLFILGQLLELVCKSAWSIRLFWLAFSPAFFGAFRLGELVSPSRFVSGGLSKEDVNLYMDRIEVFLRCSKTDQFKQGCKVVLFAVAGSDMCPVRCVREFGLVSGGHTSLLLVHEDGSFLSRYQFLAVLKKCLEAGGIPPKEFSGHSFRIGAATEAARRGLGDELVKKIGRWESIRFRSYIRPAWL
ncbi:uncharacterized protein [Phyllobates terribilis]|uniref:uncharacterized protein n=1 Tax=Phyllobates terribilis TaxID=111132 RepID=UPI003CCAA2D3